VAERRELAPVGVSLVRQVKDPERVARSVVSLSGVVMLMIWTPTDQRQPTLVGVHKERHALTLASILPVNERTPSRLEIPPLIVCTIGFRVVQDLRSGSGVKFSVRCSTVPSDQGQGGQPDKLVFGNVFNIEGNESRVILHKTLLRSDGVVVILSVFKPR
jgi:hypothetical protein